MSLFIAAKIDADFEAYIQDHVAPEDQALFEANVMLALFEDPKRQDTFGWDALASRGAEIRAHNDEHGWRKMMEGVKT